MWAWCLKPTSPPPNTSVTGCSRASVLSSTLTKPQSTQNRLHLRHHHHYHRRLHRCFSVFVRNFPCRNHEIFKIYDSVQITSVLMLDNTFKMLFADILLYFWDILQHAHFSTWTEIWSKWCAKYKREVFIFSIKILH